MTQTATPTLGKILVDFEKLYDLAIINDNIALAVKIKEIQAKYTLVFEKSTSAEGYLKQIEELSDQELQALLGLNRTIPPPVDGNE